MSLQSVIASDKANKRTGPTSALVRCPCVHHEDKKPSCSVTEGTDGLLFYCHSGCDWKDVRDGATARGWIEERKYAPSAIAPKSLAKTQSSKRTGEAAKRIWMQSTNADQSQISRAYWNSRSLAHVVLERLRFGYVYHSELRTELPTLVAGVTDIAGHLHGVHLTYLTGKGQKITNAQSKKMLGAIAGHAVHLDKAGDELAIAEGIESAAAFQQLTGIPTWATLSTSGMRSVVLDSAPVAQTIYIATDNDGPGLAAANETAQRLTLQGRTVKIVAPPVQGEDWNDALMREAC